MLDAQRKTCLACVEDVDRRRTGPAGSGRSNACSRDGRRRDCRMGRSSKDRLEPRLETRPLSSSVSFRGGRAIFRWSSNPRCRAPKATSPRLAGGWVLQQRYCKPLVCEATTDEHRRRSSGYRTCASSHCAGPAVKPFELSAERGNRVQIVLFGLLQGVFGAPMVPLVQSVVFETYPAEQRGPAMAIFGLGGGMLGPVFQWHLVQTQLLRRSIFPGIGSDRRLRR